MMMSILAITIMMMKMMIAMSYDLAKQDVFEIGKIGITAHK